MALKITILGSGYVGLVAAVGFAELGHKVACCDIDSTRIESLKKGIVPIYEPRLATLAVKNQKSGRLLFSADSAPHLKAAEVIIIAVGTPTHKKGKQGSMDKSALLSAVKDIAKSASKGAIVVVKSTVTPGTCEMLAAKLKRKGITVVSNPEFLREGKAVEDFMEPQRILIGLQKQGGTVEKTMRKLYGKLAKEHPFIVTSLTSAEVAKYACNSILAVRLSFINEIADFCAASGADWESVQKVLASDNRIGDAYLQAGPGYGGSCLPKDTQALQHEAKVLNLPMPTLNGTIASNTKRKANLIKRIEKYAGKLKNKKIALLGLAFKADSDDIRESSGIKVAQDLLSAGASLIMHDPKAMENAKKFLQGGNYAATATEALSESEVVIIMTEWNEYKKLTVKDFKKMKGNIIIDFRNLHKNKNFKGFKYHSLDSE